MRTGNAEERIIHSIPPIQDDVLAKQVLLYLQDNPTALRVLLRVLWFGRFRVRTRRVCNQRSSRQSMRLQTAKCRFANFHKPALLGIAKAFKISRCYNRSAIFIKVGLWILVGTGRPEFVLWTGTDYSVFLHRFNVAVDKQADYRFQVTI